jgi:hypothetical protein
MAASLGSISAQAASVKSTRTAISVSLQALIIEGTVRQSREFVNTP